jgi:hypothetical protein
MKLQLRSYLKLSLSAYLRSSPHKVRSRKARMLT